MDQLSLHLGFIDCLLHHVLLCSNASISLPLFLTSLYYLFKVPLFHYRFVALFYASTVSSSVSYVTKLYLQGFIVCLLHHCSMLCFDYLFLCFFRYYTISAMLPLFQYLFVRSLLCLFEASTIASSVCFATILSLQGFHYLLITSLLCSRL